MRWIVERAASVALAAALALAGCATTPQGGGDVRVVGSDTMLPLNRMLAAEFMTRHPGIAVRVEGGGTGAGVDALLGGRADLCAASRPFRADEIRRLYSEFRTMGLRYLIARDALSALIHPTNPVPSLTMAQLAAIFGGTVTDWADVGGPDGPIEVVLRPPSSGTYYFFRDHVLAGRPYTTVAMTVPRARDVDETVAARPQAIGYGGFVGSAAVRRVPIDGVAPSAAAVRSGEYPLARYLLFYATAPPRGDVAEFVDWCLGIEGQRVVARSGLVALWTDD